MATYVLGLILIVALFFAIRGGYKHFAGEGSCCGGGDDVPSIKPRQLEGEVVAKKAVHIEGMTCGNCKKRVEILFNNIEGLSAQVDLKNNVAHVKMDRQVTEAEMEHSLKGTDYKITSIVDE